MTTTYDIEPALYLGATAIREAFTDDPENDPTAGKTDEELDAIGLTILDGLYDEYRRLLDVALRGEPYTAWFSPQAWVNDYAIEVDPKGDQEWDVTEAFAALDEDYRESMLAEIDEYDEALDRNDVLKSDPNAPEWIREWQGPFSIYVRSQSYK